MARDIEYTFTGKLSEDCRSLEIDFADKIRRLLIPLKDDMLEITIKIFRRNRTIAQNSWLWGICIPTVRAWMKEINGECPSAEAMYAFFRISIVGHNVTIESINGIDTPVVSGKRFSQMNTVEFSESVEKIVQYYADLGLEIPLPVPKTNNYITDYCQDV